MPTPNPHDLKRLKLVGWLEDKVIRQVARPWPPMSYGRLNLLDVSEKTQLNNMSFKRQNVVNFRVHIGANAIVDDGSVALDAARRKVAHMLCREIYGEIREEVIDLQEWCYQSGLGEELDERLARLILLIEGREVSATMSKEPL